jgi:hypothetical protein
MRRQDGVVIIARPGLRVGVHQRGGQSWQRVQKVVLGADGDLVGLDRAGSGVDDDLAFGVQMVPDPAQPDLAGTHRRCGGAVDRCLLRMGVIVLR